MPEKRPLKEGMEKKGGLNPKPSTPRPKPPEPQAPKKPKK